MTNPNKDGVPEGAIRAALSATDFAYSALSRKWMKRALAAALPFLVQPQAGIGVKVLVWGLLTTEDGLEAQDAHCSIGHYIATSNGWFLVGQTGLNSASNLVDAKIAADGDFEARVSQPLPSPQGEGAGFPPEDFAHVAELIREHLDDRPQFHAVMSNNFNVILAALDHAGIQTKEPGNG